jgi:hypothetical protein
MPNSSCTVRTIRGSYFSAVKEHDLTRRRQVSNIALEIPLCTLFFGRLAESRNATAARIHMFYKTLDRATLARRIPPFKNGHDAQVVLLSPIFHLQQFYVQRQNKI